MARADRQRPELVEGEAPVSGELVMDLLVAAAREHGTTVARLAMLRRVVALEGAVPLLSVAAVAIGAGFAGAEMFASEAQQHPMVPPGAAYYLLTAAGIVVSLGIVAATSHCWPASPDPKSPETDEPPHLNLSSGQVPASR